MMPQPNGSRKNPKNRLMAASMMMIVRAVAEPMSVILVSQKYMRPRMTDSAPLMNR